MWPDQPLEYIKLDHDASGRHFGLFLGTALVSVISVFIDDQSAQFRKFATVVKYQNKGYGSLLLNHVIKYLMDEDIDFIWCNARKDKVAYYQRFGLYATDQVFTKNQQAYVIMKLNTKILK